MVCSKLARVVSAVAALELVAVGEGKRVHDEIERAPFLADHLEHAFDALQILDIGLFDDRGADRLGERHGAAAESAALIGEGKLGALAVQHAGDAPGDRAVVGDAHHQPLLPFINGPGSAISLVVVMVLTLVRGEEGACASSPLAVVAAEHERGVGAAEAEAVGHDAVDVDIVLTLAHDRHVGQRRDRWSRYWRISQMKPLFIINSE